MSTPDTLPLAQPGTRIHDGFIDGKDAANKETDLMTTITPETLAAVQALLPGLKVTLTSQDVPAGKHAGGTYWTALAERSGMGQVAVSTGDCPRMALGVVLSQVSRLGSRRGSTAEERAAALQAYALLPEI